MTPGCTAENCHFRDLGAEFSALGAARVGISHDDVATQRRFSDRHGFDFPLLADVDGEVARSYGVRRPISVLGTRRWTFVIDRDRRVLEVIKSETRMAAHADRAPRGAPGNARDLDRTGAPSSRDTAAGVKCPSLACGRARAVAHRHGPAEDEPAVPTVVVGLSRQHVRQRDHRRRRSVPGLPDDALHPRRRARQPRPARSVAPRLLRRWRDRRRLQPPAPARRHADPARGDEPRPRPQRPLGNTRPLGGVRLQRRRGGSCRCGQPDARRSLPTSSDGPPSPRRWRSGS